MASLLICSRPDPASVNIYDNLLRMRDWKDIGTDGKNDYLSFGEDTIMTIPEMHIHAESVDTEAKEFGMEFDDVIFLSKHRSMSAIPTLTVHPIGNYGKAEVGGRENTLTRPSPALMTECLRSIASMDVQNFQVSFEVTHHGPWLETPSFFIEIGSDETAWSNAYAGEILARSLLSIDDNDRPVAVGVGGGHYAPRFTDISLSYGINFGHMVPDHAIKDMDDDGIARTIRMAADSTDTELIYLHRSKEKNDKLRDIITTEGYEIISSKDLEPIIKKI